MSFRTAPRAVWALQVTWVLVLLSYSVLLPPLGGPDEQSHLDLVIGMGEEREVFDHDERNISERMVRAGLLLRVPEGYRNIPADLLPPRGQRPELDELALDGPSFLPNHLAAHPPLYYVPMATGYEVVTAVDADFWSVDRVALLARWLSILFLAPLPLLTFAAARRARASTRAATGAVVALFLLPELALLSATVNNDNLLTLLGGLLFLVLVPVVTAEDVSPRRAALAGLLTGLGLITKGFALSLPLWVLGAYLLVARRDWRRAVRPVLIAGAVAAAVGGWWWVRNLLQTGSPMPNVLPPGIERVPDPDVDLAGWALYLVREIAETSVFVFDTVRLRRIVSLGVAAVVAGALVVAWRTRRRDPVSARAVSLAAVAGGSAYLWVAFFTLRGHLDNGHLRGFQGRYLFIAAVPLAVLVGLALARGGRRGVTGALLLGAGVHAYASWSVLRTSYAAPGRPPGASLEALRAISPLPGVLTMALLAATIAAVVGSVRVVWLDLSDDPDQDDGPQVVPPSSNSELPVP